MKTGNRRLSSSPCFNAILPVDFFFWFGILGGNRRSTTNITFY